MIVALVVLLLACGAVFHAPPDERSVWREASYVGRPTMYRAGFLRWWWYDETWAPHGPYFTGRAARADLAAYVRYLDGGA